MGRDRGVLRVLLHLQSRPLYKSLRSTTNSLHTQGQADGESVKWNKRTDAKKMANKHSSGIMILLDKFVHIQCQLRIKWCDSLIFKTHKFRLLETEKELLFNTKPVLCPNWCLIQHTLTDQTLNIPPNETHTHIQMDRQKQTHLVNTHTGARGHTH